MNCAPLEIHALQFRRPAQSQSEKRFVAIHAADLFDQANRAGNCHVISSLEMPPARIASIAATASSAVAARTTGMMPVSLILQ